MRLTSEPSAFNDFEAIRVYKGEAKTVIYILKIQSAFTPFGAEKPFSGYPFSFYSNYGEIYSGVCSAS